MGSLGMEMRIMIRVWDVTCRLCAIELQLPKLQEVWVEGKKSDSDDLIFQILQPWCELFAVSKTKEELVESLQQFFSVTYKIELQADDEDVWLQRRRMFNRYIASVLSSRAFCYI